MKKITLLAGAVLALGMSVSAQCQLPPVWKNVAEQKIQNLKLNGLNRVKKPAYIGELFCIYVLPVR